MIKEIFSRTALLIGDEALLKLGRAKVAVFGLGGVGGHVIEALARSGVGALDLIDHDMVDISNLNRQILATLDSIGQPKVEVAKKRLLSINPELIVRTRRLFLDKENIFEFNFGDYDYIVDAIDTVSAKLDLIERATAAQTPIISAMGAGNKLDPTRLEVADISETSVCPLARVMRKELRRRGINHLKVVYSKELPVLPQTATESLNARAPRRDITGSNAFVPAVAGLLIASEAVKDLLSKEDSRK